ncbi:MAG: DeoR/GlpR transcriptional regulator [Spirochaetia bacterium]|nr:DeoR/GlpR transcriptional regulator [Spirochaetia bacterium]
MVGLSQREEQIVELLAHEGELSVTQLSDTLKVSSVTIRNYLRSLEAKGVINRSHGSAIAAYHPLFMEKQSSNAEYKKKIAQVAASMVKDGDRIMITNGTTSAFVAKYLFGKRDLSVVTNSTLISAYVRSNPSISLTMVGGEYRPSAEALVGPIALSQLENYHVDITFAGTDGFSITHGLTTHLTENAEIVRKMASRATKKVVVVDSSKFNNIGFVKICNLIDVDILITDNRLNSLAIDEISSLPIELIIV